MSKKTEKKPHATTAAVADSSDAIANEQEAPTPQHSLAEMQAAAQTHINNNAWAEILALGRLPLAAVCAEDRKEAEVWQLRAKVLGLYPPGVRSPYDLTKDAREEYEGALQQLADRVEALHTLPYEFELYLDTMGWSLADCANAFQRLTRACMEVTNANWLRKLRTRGLRMLRARDDRGDDELSEADQQALEAMPDITLVLSEAYAAAESGGALDEEGRALVKVLRNELDLQMADAWEYGRVGDALFRLDGPSEKDAAVIQTESPRGIKQQLTPKAWAFLWDLEHTAAAGFAGLLKRYPEPFACDACEGLRQATLAFTASPREADEHMAAALHHLMRFVDDGEEYCFGERLTMLLADGPQQIYVGSSLRMASISDLLLRLCENAPEGFNRRNELDSLYRIYNASTQYSPLEGEAQGDQNMPGLAWLCERSISFQFAAAYAIQGVAGRMRLFVDALRRATEAGVSPAQNYFSGDLDAEELEEPEAWPLLDALERLAAVRSQMDETCRRMWLEAAGDVFNAISKVGDKARERLLSLAREFSDDLLERNHSFRLGYLEQVAGDPDEALRYYLIDIDTSEAVPESAVKNAKLLCVKTDSQDQAQRFVDALEEEAGTSNRADVVQQLLTDAKARLTNLNKRDQFERTAVSRWPSLTAPARKLLSVFATIKRYNGLAEVAEYAGMELVWAGRHYDKLVELGMLLVTDTTFRINPHIAPLLERESQHAVIGRIVRAQGTSAVKQVFNSQREFNIYQVLVQLCPNHLVFPNCSLQSVMSYERMKELVSEDDFGYYLRASVDIVVVSSTTYLPMLAIEVDSVWHDTERQQRNDDKKDRLFAAAGIPFMRLRPVGSPSENTIRAQVAEHVDDLVRSLRSDLPGYDQARGLLEDLSGIQK